VLSQASPSATRLILHHFRNSQILRRTLGGVQYDPPKQLKPGLSEVTGIAYNLKAYGKLLAETLPAVIDSDAEYDRLEGVFN